MPDNNNYLVKNLTHKPCGTCGGDHEFLSRKSNHARCGTPVAFSRDVAEDMAKAHNGDLYADDSFIKVPDDTVVILDDSARKLKQQGGGTVPLDQAILHGMRTV